MKFTLEIELGNDAMRSYQDIRDALKQVILSAGSCASSHARPTDGDGAKIMDLNGNSVGTWGVTKDAPAAITAPPCSASAFLAECNRRKEQGNPPPAPDDPYWSK
jgi:uncharacterized protein (DUF2141 family)